MNSRFTYCAEQYNLVRDSRSVLLTFCAYIRAEDFLQPLENFGRGGSVRNLLVHIANTYEFWIGHIALKNKTSFTPYESIQSHSEVVALFRDIDQLMDLFFKQMEEKNWKDLKAEIQGIPQDVNPFRLFSHVITHEFHHKGQILSLSRRLGYTPVDTDIMR